jgi:Flp pilus assembly pilin Flp
MAAMKIKFQGWRGRKKGQTLVEYALILAFIAIVAISVLYWQGLLTGYFFYSVNQAMSSSVSSH